MDGQAAPALLHPSTPLQQAQPQPASPNSPFAISPFASSDTGFFSSSEGLPPAVAPGAEARPAAVHAGWPAAAEEAQRPPRGAAAPQRAPLAQRAKAVFTAMERLVGARKIARMPVWGVRLLHSMAAAQHPAQACAIPHPAAPHVSPFQLASPQAAGAGGGERGAALGSVPGAVQ